MERPRVALQSAHEKKRSDRKAEAAGRRRPGAVLSPATRRGPSSDLDLFIDYDPDKKFSLVDLTGIKLYLEDEFATAVDITTRDSLHPMLKDRIESSALQVF